MKICAEYLADHPDFLPLWDNGTISSGLISDLGWSSGMVSVLTESLYLYRIQYYNVNPSPKGIQK